MKSDLRVIPPDSASWVNQTTLKNMFGAHVASEPGGNQRNIRMFAEMDPEIYTPQYIFLRAVDNGGAVSEVIQRKYSRNNHRPEAKIDVDSLFKIKNHYCLKDTTVTWKGITISWSGLDTADYDIRNQPEFQFKWELVGPFVSAPGRNDTLPVVDSSWDTSLIGGDRRWTSEELHVFKNLKNYGEDKGADADSGFGWYKLRVRVRDDCFVSTDTATALNFRIVKPRFLYADSTKKTILVVDATAYSKLQEGSPQDTGEVRSFYRDALNSLPAGLCHSFAVWWDPNKTPDAVDKNPPGEDRLSRFDLVILLNLGEPHQVLPITFMTDIKNT